MSPYDLDAGAFPIVLHLSNTVQMFPSGPSIQAGVLTLGGGAGLAGIFARFRRDKKD